MNNMKKELALILAVLLCLILFIKEGYALHDKKTIVPYGDFCDRVSKYGIHRHMLNNKQVRQALKHYFEGKGLDFEIIKSKGRFIKVNIVDKGKAVDTIIFDRHTGRIRSIH
jgi:hypothetical protein